MRNGHKHDTKLAVAGAYGIAYDGCHKIYILDDALTFAEQKSYGYGDGTDSSLLIHIDTIGEDAATQALIYWFDNSCSLRFISKISATDHHSIIEQGH